MTENAQTLAARFRRECPHFDLGFVRDRQPAMVGAVDRYMAARRTANSHADIDRLAAWARNLAFNIAPERVDD